ncbi:MAG: GntR family transcriptional regulator [Clostridia bacterium]|nr:GntR family transcriptional regulator [Clostridia bacterium]
MDWILDKKRPLCPQICEQICARITADEWQAGERLPSVREVAMAAGVNPNTVQRSFETLEGQGILFSVRGSGWFVAENTQSAVDGLTALRQEKTAAFFAAMEALGMTKEEIKSYVKEWSE